MLKIICLCSFLLLVSWRVAAQETITNYYDVEGNTTSEINALYYTVKKNVYNEVDTIRSFYAQDHTLRSIEAVNAKGSRNGLTISYYQSGIVKSKVTYKDGMVNGDALSWYPNGRPQSVELFSPRNDSKNKNSKLLDYWDSLGNQIVSKGRGYCECVFNIPFRSKLLEKGRIEEGVRDSIWVGYRADGTKYYEEKYVLGELLNGVSFDDTGNQYAYNTMAEMAAPLGGMQGFYEHVAHNLRYPKAARKNRIQGKVFVEFIVDRSGTVTDVQAIKGISEECDKEAVAVVKSCPPWKPGKQRGQPVKLRMVIPINFKLG